MSKQTRVSHPIYSLLPTEVEGFDSLAELALEMRWSWNHATDKVWRQLDPALWELTQNPWVVLQTVSRDQLERMLTDPAYSKNIDDLLRAKRQPADDVAETTPALPPRDAWLAAGHQRSCGRQGRPARARVDPVRPSAGQPMGSA